MTNRFLPSSGRHQAACCVAACRTASSCSRDIYKLLSREADLVLARQPPLPAAAVGSSGGSSSGAVEAYATTQPLSGLDRASTQEAGAATAGGVLEGVEQYSVTLEPGLLVSHAVLLLLFCGYCYSYLVARAINRPSPQHGSWRLHHLHTHQHTCTLEVLYNVAMCIT